MLNNELDELFDLAEQDVIREDKIKQPSILET